MKDSIYQQSGCLESKWKKKKLETRLQTVGRPDKQVGQYTGLPVVLLRTKSQKILFRRRFETFEKQSCLPSHLFPLTWRGTTVRQNVLQLIKTLKPETELCSVHDFLISEVNISWEGLLVGSKVVSTLSDRLENELYNKSFASGSM